MKNEAKKLIKELKAGRDMRKNVRRYSEVLSTAFTDYAVVKLSLNFFTLMEMIDALPDDRKEITLGRVSDLKKALNKALTTGEIDEADIKSVLDIRDAVTEKMKILTAYTDVFSIYEYVAVRRDPEYDADDDAQLDTAGIAENMYNYVFQDDDKMLINSKIQSLIAELPVRMTKDRFFDIISNTLNIYRGGEKEAVDDFTEMIRTAAVLSVPEGFDDEYPELSEIYGRLKENDFKAVTKADHLAIVEDIERATDIINAYVTDYLMLIEVVNDTLTILLTLPNMDKNLLDDKYDISVRILTETVNAEDIYKAAEGFDELFVSLEGVQEEAYETLATVDSSLFDVCDSYNEAIAEEGIEDIFAALNKADKLTSTSLFIDLDRDIRVVNDAAGEEYIAEKKDELEKAFRKRFDETSVPVRRGIMAKVLAVLPVFFNNKEEIREYFNYALEKCADRTELSASVDKINELILGE
ncbi:MAG: hypothetical protein IJJ74_02380 [Eubacterium sp.]|nr:hypothetical protein [Eubacterium sp.]